MFSLQNLYSSSLSNLTFIRCTWHRFKKSVSTFCLILFSLWLTVWHRDSVFNLFTNASTLPHEQETPRRRCSASSASYPFQVLGNWWSMPRQLTWSTFTSWVQERRARHGALALTSRRSRRLPRRISRLILTPLTSCPRFIIYADVMQQYFTNSRSLNWRINSFRLGKRRRVERTTRREFALEAKWFKIKDILHFNL